MSNFYGRLTIKSTSAARARVVRGVAIMATVVLTFNIACLVIYNTHTVRSLLTTDAATKNLIAAEMVRSKEFFLTDWYYVNGDLWTFFSHLLILPLLPYFPNGFALHAFAGLVTATLILLCSWWLLRSLRTPSVPKIWTLAVLASGISGSMAWALFGETGYGWILFTSLIFLGLTIPFLSHGAELGQRSRITLSVLILLLSVIVHAGNPMRALASYFLPATGGLIALCIASIPTTQQSWRFWAARAGVPFIALFVGGLIGTGVHMLVIRHLNNIVGAGAAVFLPIEQLGRSAGFTLLGLISLLGGEPTVGQRLPTLPGVFAVLRLLAALAMLLLPLWLIRKNFRRLHASQQFVAGFAATAFGVVLCVCMLTNTPDYSDVGAARASARYFAPSLVLLLIVSASMAQSIQSAMMRAAMLGIALIVSASGWTVLVSEDPSKTDDVRSAVLKVLRENGLQNGYATYWNAGVYTVLTGEEVKVRQVQLTPGGIIPMRHLSAGRWYTGSQSNRLTFLLLNESEYKWLQQNGLLGCPHAPVKTLAASSVRILVYDQDFSESALGWDDGRSYSKRRVCLLAQTPRTVGKFVSDPAGLRSSPINGPGYLMFGPYISLRAGNYVYQATVRIESERDESAGAIDVIGGGGQDKFALLSLPNRTGTHTVELEFSLAQDVRDLELRTWVSGSANVTLENAALIRRDLGVQKRSTLNTLGR